MTDRWPIRYAKVWDICRFAVSVRVHTKKKGTFVWKGEHKSIHSELNWSYFFWTINMFTMLKKIVRLINNIFAVRGHCIKCTHTALLVLIKREWKRERERERKSAKFTFSQGLSLHLSFEWILILIVIYQ